ncbi:LysM peptidoglycan-binding domain-containing protein [Dactylosporangium sp. AC04546]|uniref:LysM peptidoglycan-binding domain-containing protein n=1 Tax=Dactylosporangium sp. AC04546 TaxID=2862460 RepID=UPI001EE11922|nr:LysM peptidoglycan-binding domain-containing protein [Dactylosporangium sp. AC04546]WVK78951.1 LysM peptidoglycan-binding domain-containing protein [Dactylosporangium sp. AC04546]
MWHAGWLVAGLVGLPWPLHTFGRAVFDSIDLALVVADPMSPAAVALGAVATGWAVWGALVYTTLADVIDTVRRGTANWRLPVPVHAAVSSAAGSLMLLFNNIMGSFGSAAPAAAAPAAPAAGDEPTPPAMLPAVPPTPLSAIDVPLFEPRTAELTGVTIVGPPVLAAPAATYVVRRGDTLSRIAADQLGDAGRWTDICDLNWHRHWAAVGGTLRDCDVIYPGWDLAMPPGQAAPSEVEPQPPTTDVDPGDPAGDPGGDPGGDPDGVVEPSTAAPTEAPGSTSAGPSTATSSGPTTETGASASEPPSSSAPTIRPTHDGGAADSGVQLPSGSYLPWTLALVIAAAASVAVARRRRARQPSDDHNADATGLTSVTSATGQIPAAGVAAQVYQAVRRRSAQRDATTISRDVRPSTGAGDPADRDDPDRLEPLAGLGGLDRLGGWVGLVGDGAHGAARGILATVLSADAEQQPPATGSPRGARVVVTRSTFTTLLGITPAQLEPWPALHVAADIDELLTVADTVLLQRARHAAHDSDEGGDGGRRAGISRQPLLLLVDHPSAQAEARLRRTVTAVDEPGTVVVVAVGSPFGDSAIDVDTDGYTHVLAGPPLPSVADRIGTLTTADAVDLLTTLRAAHMSGSADHDSDATSEVPGSDAPTTDIPRRDAAVPGASQPTASTRSATASDSPERPVPATPVARAAASVEGPRTAEPSAGDGHEQQLAGRTARLRVLGRPRIEDTVLPGRPLRAKAAELAVFLACHPDGADTATIADQLLPDVRLRAANQQVHTNASNLRHVLGRAGGSVPGGHLVKHGATARYRLDPDTVEVDLWQLRELLNRARLASGDTRAALLTEACAVYTAPLADGCDYDWVEPHRETARRLGVEAHVLLADDLLGTDPAAADERLITAISLDRYNEDLYRRAMQARHALRDSGGIRALLDALTTALRELDTEPDDTTVTLARQLRADLNGRRPASHDPHRADDPAIHTAGRRS